MHFALEMYSSLVNVEDKEIITKFLILSKTDYKM